ncbi:MAG: HAMP domain-containing histidine kinase [Chloroflexi bacterium]|nr:HAMP domain-containing histidine kinase [Chloroflexota bacterium]
MSPRRDADHLSIVMHELRNPLVGIEAAARVLAKDLRTHPAEQRAQAIATETRHMLALLESVADAEAAAAGRLRSILRPIDLAALVGETAESMHLNGHPVKLRGTDVPVRVQGDDRRIRQVLANLLTNAAAYSPPKGIIEVTVGVDPRRRTATVEVRDHGPGIPPLERRKLFSKFGRLSTAGGTRGSGLGLYVSRAIIRDHHGEIGFDSASGGGSAFSFSLPLLESEDAARPAKATRKAAPKRTTPKRRSGR